MKHEELIKIMKLYMEYNLSETLSENKLRVLKEQDPENQANLMSWNKNPKTYYFYKKNRLGDYELVITDLTGYNQELQNPNFLVNYKRDSGQDLRYGNKYIFGPEIKELFPNISDYNKLPSRLNSEKKPIQNYRILGPYFPNSDKVGGLPFENGKIIVDKPTDKENGLGEGFYWFENLGNTDIEIKSITSSNPKVILTVFGDKIVKPGKVKKIVAGISIPKNEKVTDENIEKINSGDKIPKDKIPRDRDNTTYRIPNIDILPEIKVISEPTKATLDLGPDGKYVFFVRFGLDPRQVEQDRIINNVNSRKTPNGYYTVPEGFSPFEYEDFIEKVKKVSCATSKTFSYVLQKITEEGETPAPGDIPALRERDVRCWDEYKKLYEEYYSEHFPRGIHREDKIEFENKITEIDKKIEDFKSNHMVRVPGVPYATFEYGKGKVEKQTWQTKFDPNKLETKDLLEWNKLVETRNSLVLDYGYDERTSFQRWMDSGWGQAFQLGAMVVLMVAGLVCDGCTWAGAIAIANYVFTGFMTYHFASRGHTREAAVWFCFFFIGKLHPLYEAIWGKVSRAVGKESLESIGLGIAKALEGVQVTTSAELRTLMYTKMTYNQRLVFREFLRQAEKSPEVIKASLEGMAKEIEAAKTAMGAAKWSEAMKLLPNLGQIARGMTVDLVVVIPAVTKAYDELKAYLKTKNIDFLWGERDGEILQQITQKLNNAEIIRLFSNLEEVMKLMDPPSLKYYVDKLNELEKIEELNKYYSQDMTPQQLDKVAEETFIELRTKVDNKKVEFKKYFDTPDEIKNLKKDFEDYKKMWLEKNRGTAKDSTGTIKPIPWDKP